MSATTRKPRVLFLSFHFPPLRSVVSIRTGSIAKHLGRIGWDVTVVTPHPAVLAVVDEVERTADEMARCGVKFIHTDYRWRYFASGHIKRVHEDGGMAFLEKVTRRARKLLAVDEGVGWYPEAELACASLVPGDFDVILATGGPFGTHRMAGRLSSRLNVPFVLDYRDLWFGNPDGRTAIFGHARRQERALLAKCAGVSVVSPSMVQVLDEQFGVQAKVTVITNGYDPSELESVRPLDFGHFAIVYAGRFYPPRRSAAPVMYMLQRLKEHADLRPWQFHYYGPSESHVRKVAIACGVDDRVVCHGFVSRNETLAAIRGAGAAMIVTSVYDTHTNAERGILSGKLYEVLGLRTPAVVIAPDGSDCEGILQASGGGAVFRGSDVNGPADFLAGLMLGRVPGFGHSDRYSWPRLIEQMDGLLHSAIRPQ